MAQYLVMGPASASVTIAVGEPTGVLWNPASARRIRVLDVHWGLRGDAGATILRFIIQRVSTAGSGPDSTHTVGAPNSAANDAVPDSGAVLYMGPFATDPALVAGSILYSPLSYQAGATQAQPAFYLPTPRGIWVPPGTGLSVVQVAGEIIERQELGFLFED